MSSDVYVSNQPAGTYGGVVWGTPSDSNDGFSALNPKETFDAAATIYKTSVHDGFTLYVNDGEYDYTLDNGRWIFTHESTNIQPMNDYDTTITFNGIDSMGIRLNAATTQEWVTTIGNICLKTSENKTFAIYSSSVTDRQLITFNCGARIVPPTSVTSGTLKYGIYMSNASCIMNFTGGICDSDGSLIDISSEQYDYRPIFFGSSSSKSTIGIPTILNFTGFEFNINAKVSNGVAVIDLASQLSSGSFLAGSQFNLSGITGTFINSQPATTSINYFIELEEAPSNSIVENCQVDYQSVNKGACFAAISSANFPSTGHVIRDNNVTIHSENGLGFGAIIGKEGSSGDSSSISGDIHGNNIAFTSNGVNDVHGLNHIYAEGSRYNNIISGVAIGSLCKQSGSSSYGNTITVDPNSTSKVYLYSKGSYAGASFKNETLISDNSAYSGNFIQSLHDDSASSGDLDSNNPLFENITITGTFPINSRLFVIGEVINGDNSTATVNGITIPDEWPEDLNEYAKDVNGTYTTLEQVNALAYVSGVVTSAPYFGYYNYPNRKNNSKPTAIGIGPHDYVEYVYDANERLIEQIYYKGGQQSSGELVAHVITSYDANGNINGRYRQDVNPLANPLAQNPQLTSIGTNPILFDV